MAASGSYSLTVQFKSSPRFNLDLYSYYFTEELWRCVGAQLAMLLHFYRLSIYCLVYLWHLD